MDRRSSVLADLFFSFMKGGLFTLGGGYAMISVITDICVQRKQWLSQEEMLDLTVVAESTPGPIAINCATYVGCKMAGMSGAVLATLGIVLPSFVILYCISMFLEHFLEYRVVAAACMGIKVGVGLLVLDAGLTMLKKMKKKPQPRIIAGCAFAVMLLSNIFRLGISSVVLMLTAGVISLSVFIAREKPVCKGGEGR